MQLPSIRLSQPTFGLFSPAARRAMIQHWHGVSPTEAMQMDASATKFSQRYVGKVLPFTIAGAAIGFVSTFLNKKLSPFWLFLGFTLLGMVAASINTWPEAKQQYAAMRNKSPRTYPDYVDALYGYKPSSN